MRGFLILLGLLLVLGGGALAGAQYAPIDLSMLDSVAGAKEFVASPMALYAGAGAAGFGLLLIVIAVATGGKKEEPVQVARAAPAKAEPARPKEDIFTLRPAPAMSAAKAAEPPRAVQPPADLPKPQPQAAPPWTAAPTPQPAPAPVAKPTASGQPPPSSENGLLGVWRRDPRLLNRKRVTDLVSINDALKAYYAKNGAYPKATGLSGFRERGAAWIPGLSPDFLADLPRDPALSNDMTGPQYVYVSDGADYKLLAQGVSLVGGTQVEVLGVRIDPTRQPTAENASFGFWSPGFASA